jgi:hypothetical protein
MPIKSKTNNQKVVKPKVVKPKVVKPKVVKPKISSTTLQQKAAGYLLASANALKKETNNKR